jgi:hypothetical protein
MKTVPVHPAEPPAPSAVEEPPEVPELPPVPPRKLGLEEELDFRGVMLVGMRGGLSDHEISRGLGVSRGVVALIRYASRRFLLRR